MKVTEHLAQRKGPLFSFEIIPPPRGRSINQIIEMVETLSPLNPSWIDVTSHSSVAFYKERNDGVIEKRTFRKRPGTLGICGIIQNRFKIDTVAHLLCLGFSREETEDALIELSFLGIENIMALRGDGPNFAKPLRLDRTQHDYASSLVTQVVELRSGGFLNDLENAQGLDFCVGVAGYPEKHFEAASMKLDLNHLKNKVDVGSDYIMTQMFFNNQKYFEYVNNCRELGIKVPIIPGLKILRSMAQLRTLPKAFYIDLPDDLVAEVMASPKHVEEIGYKWAKRQCLELLEFGVPCLHFYVMNDCALVTRLVKELQK